jgi:endonuclease-3
LPGDTILSDKIVILNDLLIRKYGPKPRMGHDPLDTLMLTILSQNTNDINRDRAFDALRQRFSTWQAVQNAPADNVVEAIKTAGLANQKGPRMQEALSIIAERAGSLNLDFLEQMDLEEARLWLMSINGVGPKTAAIVLCFAFGRPAFPVDTHVHRVSKRLGLIGPKATREKAHVILENLVPPELCHVFHLNLIEHGRHVCRAGQPLCEICTIRDYCDYAQNDL